jgi:hypothetical protein
MNRPAIAASTPLGFVQRTVTWWLAQVKHALPPTIFFFVGFNLILWTKRLILQGKRDFLRTVTPALLADGLRIEGGI